jgi:hypothetical protein
MKTMTRPADTAPRPGTDLDQVHSERDFTTLRAAYRESGGIARGDELARRLEDHRCGDFVSLARLIVSGEVISFEWGNSYWVPMFQFAARDLSLRRGPLKVVAELAPVLDGWAIASWFAQPNGRLVDRRPIDLVDSNRPAVLDAARAERAHAAALCTSD